VRLIVRNMSTPECREFWESAERAAAEAETWPDWKRAGINVAQQRSVPRVLEPKRGGR